jgi:hypothetical protein
VEQVEKMIHDSPWVTNLGDEWLKFGGFKVNLDGGMTIGTAYQREPYGPNQTFVYGEDHLDNRGTLAMSPEKLYGIMKAARDRGWQLSAHAQGGGAEDLLLQTFEKLNHDKPIGPSRSHVIHASLQSPEALALCKKLGVLLDVQTDWIYLDGVAMQQVISPAAMKYFIPLRSILDAGVMAVGGSDHFTGWDKNTSLNPYNPFLEMWIAVTRKTRQGVTLQPEQRITREEALKMYTSSPAYMEFAEKERGTIETGKFADLTVIDRDFFKVPEDQIKDIQPVMTLVGGRVVYAAR